MKTFDLKNMENFINLADVGEERNIEILIDDSCVRRLIIDPEIFRVCKVKMYEYKNGLYIGSENSNFLYLVKTINDEVSEIEIHKECQIIAPKFAKDLNQLKRIVFTNIDYCDIKDEAFSNLTCLEELYFNPDGRYGFASKVFSSCKKIRKTILPRRFSDSYMHYTAFSGTLLENVLMPRDSSKLDSLINVKNVYVEGETSEVEVIDDIRVSQEDYAFNFHSGPRASHEESHIEKKQIEGYNYCVSIDDFKKL